MVSQAANSVLLQKKQSPQEMVNGHDDAVAALDAGHARAGVLDDAHELVAEDVAVLHARDLAAVDVQVGAADGGGGDAQDDVVVVLRARDRGRSRRERPCEPW